MLHAGVWNSGYTHEGGRGKEGERARPRLIHSTSFLAVSVKGQWTAESHSSLELPGNPHFSPLVGLTHTEGSMGFDIGPARARSCGMRWL